MDRRRPFRAVTVKLIVHLSSWLPLPLAHAFGVFIGWALVILPNELRRVTRRNITLCFPALSSRERQRMVRCSLLETGKTLMEAGPLWYGAPRRVRRWVREVRGEAALEAALKQGRGVILAIPHLGAWELVGLYCSMHYRMTSLYRPPRLAELDDAVRAARERFGSRLVPTTSGGVKQLYTALRAGELVALLPDQDPGESGGVFAPFFGVIANTVALVHRLVERTHAELVFAYAERLPWGRGYRLIFSPPPEGLDVGDATAFARSLNDGVERCVRALPCQYQWSYRRFRTRPPGEGGLY